MTTATGRRNERAEAEQLAKDIQAENNYIAVRVLDDNSIAAICDLFTTRSIILGLSRNFWERRFCFSDRPRANIEFAKLKSEDDEPTGYSARRPKPYGEM